MDGREVANIVAARGEVCFWIHRLVSEVSILSLTCSGRVIGCSLAFEDAYFLLLAGSQRSPLGSIHGQAVSILRIENELLSIRGLHRLLDILRVDRLSLSSPQECI